MRSISTTTDQPQLDDRCCLGRFVGLALLPRSQGRACRPDHFCGRLSHWLLDFTAHRADMPLAPSIPRYYGLGLYNSRPGMIAVEGLIWLGGIVIYLRGTRSMKRIGTYVFWTGVAVLTWLWLVSLNGLAPPGSIVKTGISSLVFMLLTVAWAYWVDGLRTSRSKASAHDIASSAKPGGLTE